MKGVSRLNRSAKTPGVIKSFSSKPSSVLKWCLNRADAAINSQALRNMAGLDKEEFNYKQLRPSQILLSETLVTRIMNILEDEYINPFDTDIDQSKLLNLSSGISVPDDTEDSLLNLFENGKLLADKFRNERLLSTNVDFHETVKRQACPSFSTKKVTISKDNKTKTIEVNRNIICNLIKYSAKNERVIDLEKALQYPLSPIPLSISHPDGSRRTTTKSKLKDIILEYSEEQPSDDIESNDIVIVNMIAQIRVLKLEMATTYESFADAFVRSLPRGFGRIDLIADTYKEGSIKSMERIARGETDKILIKSLKSKMPRDVSRLLGNGENKTRLMELIVSYIDQSKTKVFNLLRCTKIVVSLDKKCIVMTRSDTSDDASLESNQEEADTKVILHAYHCLIESISAHVTIRSPSGDTDILVLAVALLFNFRERVTIDDDKGDNRKRVKLKDLNMEEETVDALLGFHSYTGNDYVSSFFRKGKLKCFQVFEKSSKFKQIFSQLGANWELSSDLLSRLEEFTCHLYGSRTKDIDKLRYKNFNKKYLKENKIIDLSLLPPCKSVLKFHSKRANYVAAHWKRSIIANVESPQIAVSGWFQDGSIHWIDGAFPSDIEDMFLDENFDKNDFECGDEGESETES